MAELHKVEDAGRVQDGKKYYNVIYKHPSKDVDGNNVFLPEPHQQTEDEIQAEIDTHTRQRNGHQAVIDRLENTLAEIRKIE